MKMSQSTCVLFLILSFVCHQSKNIKISFSSDYFILTAIDSIMDRNARVRICEPLARCLSKRVGLLVVFFFLASALFGVIANHFEKWKWPWWCLFIAATPLVISFYFLLILRLLFCFLSIFVFIRTFCFDFYSLHFISFKTTECSYNFCLSLGAFCSMFGDFCQLLSDDGPPIGRSCLHCHLVWTGATSLLCLWNTEKQIELSTQTISSRQSDNLSTKRK
jgi:hypothetical protein